MPTRLRPAAINLKPVTLTIELLKADVDRFLGHNG